MQKAPVSIGVLRPDIKLVNENGRALLFDPGADTYFKVSGKVLEVISFMTERVPFPDFQKKLAANGVLITDGELIDILLFLQQNNLLVPEYGEVSAKQEKIKELKARTRMLRFSSAYLFFRLPPWRPEKLFAGITPWVSPLVSPVVIAVLGAFALAGYLLVLRDAHLIKNVFADTLSWMGLVKYFLAVILLKVLHEAAHSMAAMRFRCRVRGIGVGFMLFYPRLYTDTTDSWRLPRRQRLLIDAAGIIAELIIGGIAALIWSNLPPGTLKSTMFYIFTVSTVSTLLVNGNPFIRYDGYYILCDLLNIENLMQRATGYVKQCWRYYLLKLGTPPRDERGLLLFFFGIGSFCYRIFLYTSIILIIYHRFTKSLAIIMLILEFYAILLYPCWVEFKTLRHLAGKRSGMPALLFLAAVGCSAGFILWLPLSWGIALPGEVVPEDRWPVIAREAGYLQDDLKHFPAAVRKGEVLFRLENPMLTNAVRKLERTVAYDKTLLKLQQVDEEEFSKAAVTEKKIQSDLVALDELRRRQKNLTVRAEADGVFVKMLPDLFAGGYLPGNTNVGEILSGSTQIYAYANDRDIAQIRIGMTADIRTGDALGSGKAEVIFIDTVPGEMQAGPLLQLFGGAIPVYPDEKKFIPVQTLYRITLRPVGQAAFAPGRTVFVNLHHKERFGKYLMRFLLVFFRKEF